MKARAGILKTHKKKSTIFQLDEEKDGDNPNK